MYKNKQDTRGREEKKRRMRKWKTRKEKMMKRTKKLKNELNRRNNIGGVVCGWEGNEAKKIDVQISISHLLNM